MKIGKVEIGGKHLALICGPCVIESEEHALRCAEEVAKIDCAIFKASYDKANRSSIDSYRGPGLEEGLRILERIRKEFSLPVYTDVHTPEEARAAAEVCDAIQIPAFLCRQTDLLIAAGKTDKPVGIKKGQFMAPWDMGPAVQKCGGKVFLIDRGTIFGYNNLVADMRAIPIMQELGCPVCFDATHSTQLPGAGGSHSGGQSQYAPHLARAAIAAGADCLFIEAHPNPKAALSDAATQLDFATLTALLPQLRELYSLIHV